MKAEFFERSYMMAMILTEFHVAFAGFSKMETYGERWRVSDRTLLAVAMVPRFADVVIWLYY